MGIYADTPDNPGLLTYRLRKLEGFQEETELWRREVDTDRNSLVYMQTQLNTIKRVLVGLLVSFVGGSASVTIAILLSTHPHL